MEEEYVPEVFLVDDGAAQHFLHFLDALRGCPLASAPPSGGAVCWLSGVSILHPAMKLILVDPVQAKV